MSTPQKESPETTPKNSKGSPKSPSKGYTYALLMETSGEECESWYSFIRYQGNEEALQHLQNQLEQVEWEIVDDLSTFDLELENLVSEQTAKEMTKVDLNHTSFHRKFDGKLKKIDLKFKNHKSKVKKMTKAFDVLGYGGIEKFIDKEDVDLEDVNNDSDTEESSEESNEDEESSTASEEPVKKKKGAIPDVLLKKTNPAGLDMPRFAKTKAKRKTDKT